MRLNDIKRTAAVICDVTGINRLGHLAQKLLFGSFIRVVNYHDIGLDDVSNFEAHLKFYATRFHDVTESSLRTFLKTGEWPHSRPGLIISFDDGCRSHYERAAPIIEKHGFTGWFFVPAGLVLERLSELPKEAEPADPDQVLSLEQLRYLDSNHVIGCHTETHCRLSADLPFEKLRFETIGAKESLEKMLGHEMKIFCWVGGEEFSYSQRAAELIREGFEIGFMTNNAVVRQSTDPLQIQRTNIEAGNPLPLVRFQLSGILDLYYGPKRRRVNKLTA